MKKIFLILSVFTLLVSMTSCSQQSDTTSDKTSVNSVSDTTSDISVIDNPDDITTSDISNVESTTISAINSETENSKNEETSKNKETSKSTETTKSAKSSKPTETSKKEKTSKSTKTEETSKSVETSKPTKATTPTATSKPVEQSKPVKPSKPTVVDVTSVVLNKTSLSLTVGDSNKLSATVNPSNATNKNIMWTTTDKTVVSVDNNGNVKALKAGTANITAKSNNGKTAKCQITVKSKPVAPSKPKVEGLEINPFTVGSTTGTTMTVLKLWPANADISNLKITIVENPNNIISYSKMSRQPGNGSVVAYDVYFKVNKNATQDAIGKVKVECNGLTSYAEFTVVSSHDSQYENYYGPFTKKKINAIVKDMRKYGESLGMTWNDSYNITWNANQTEYTCDQSFYFPALIRDSEGLHLRNRLFKEVRRPCEEENDYEYTQFKVVPIQVYRPGTVDHGDWSFYVLYG